MRCASNTRRGFTLIEVLVVILITSIVLAVLISVLGSSFQILRASESRAQLISNCRTALEYMSKNVGGASYIPISSDRDLNGYPDEWSNTALNPNAGYGLNALWRVAENQGSGNIFVWTRYMISEAWADRLMTVHSSKSYFNGQIMQNQTFTVPRVLVSAGNQNIAEYTSLFRLAIPANNLMPYYLAPPGRAGINGVMPDYPQEIALGPHKETAALTQDLFYHRRDSDVPGRVRQVPIASNITRIKFEYLHQVPVYQSRVSGGTVQIAMQDLSDGSIDWVDAQADAVDNQVPMIDHWEQRIIDVAYDDVITDSSDPDGTGITYAGTFWNLADQYPEEDTIVDPNRANALNNWNCSVYYNDPPDDPINAPIDRRGFVTMTADANGNPVEGGLAKFRPDMVLLQGSNYQTAVDAIDANASGTFGDADGIPDGDGTPDNPVPAWWLPYMRAVRITVVATPQRVIEDRIAKSGKAGKLGGNLYYRLDSPVPFSDAARTVPLTNQTQDYVGTGQDIVMTKTIPVNYTYRLDLITDPRDPRLATFEARRVDLNYRNGELLLFYDPASPDDATRPLGPVEKLFEKDSSLP